MDIGGEAKHETLDAQKIASKANRNGVAAWCPDAAVHQSVEVDLSLSDCSDQ
jgi:hypothetical protein